MQYFPRWLLDGLGVNFYFGGTSLLIVVGVAMDTVNQIEAQLIMRHYEGFTPRAGRIRGRRSGDLKDDRSQEPGELEKMRRSGLLVHEVLQKLGRHGPGRRHDLDLEVEAERMIRDAGARPAFKGYYTASAGSKYPFVLCTSVNE